jgi:putative nucleotidyltransferase with HDIG domain
MSIQGSIKIKEHRTMTELFLGKGVEYDTRGEWDKALRCFEKALDTFETEDDEKLKVEVLRRMGHIKSKKGEWKDALNLYEESLRICESEGDLPGKAYALSSIGTVYLEQGCWDRVKEFYAEALGAARQTKDIKLIAQIYNNMGAMNNILGNWEEAIRHYRKCIPLFEELGNEKGLAETYHNLGITSVDKGDLDGGDRYFLESLKISVAIKDIRLSAYSSLNRAEISRLNKDFEHALELGKKACSVLEEVDDKLGMAEAHRIVGAIERELGEVDKAEKIILQSVDINRRYDNPLGIAESYRELGLTYLKQENSKSALEALSESFKVFREIKARKSLEDVDSKIFELEDLYFQIAKSMGEGVESKDTYTFGHSQRVANYALAIAKVMDLSIEERKSILLASFLHDLGKIDVDTDILTKPGKLTDEEFEVIKKHPMWGVEKLASINFPWEVKSLILHHQERWNGSGYPMGLVEHNIPLGARIIAVADFFDALTTDRPYRDALSLEVTLEIIEEETGKILDPEITPIFVDMIISKAEDCPTTSSSDHFEFLQLWNSQASLRP